jgi:hypothetical protein
VLITAASCALKSARGGSIMSAVGNRACVGLLSALVQVRERAEGGPYHYQRSCPVAEVRVSQLGWSRRRDGMWMWMCVSELGKSGLRMRSCVPGDGDGADLGTRRDGGRGRLLYLILHALRHGSWRDGLHNGVV